MTLGFWGLGALGLGLGLFLIRLSHLRRLKEKLWQDVLRDVGIAFVVAVIISVVYEVNTRSIAEHESFLDTINKAISAFVPENIWAETRDEILRRKAIRRNLDIKLKFPRDGVLSPAGQKISLGKNQAMMWMSYGYDLYGLTAGPSEIIVQHELALEMRDEAQNLPRFERVSVKTANAPEKIFENQRLMEIYDGKGSIKLAGNDIVELPPLDKGVPVHITTERYEIVNTPGSYSLIMPELVANAPKSPSPTIRISVEGDIPDDIELEVKTYYQPHSIVRPNANENVWTYEGIMLPGQGFNFVFKIRGSSSATHTQ